MYKSNHMNQNTTSLAILALEKTSELQKIALALGENLEPKQQRKIYKAAKKAGKCAKVAHDVLTQYATR